jgi:predicted RNA-binding Zn ribbon-like protein
MPFTRKKFEAEGFAQRYAWLDVVNSEEFDGFWRATDHLKDSTWMRAFLGHWNLGPRIGSGTEVERLGQLRDFLRRTAERIAGGKRLTTTDLSRINRSFEIPLRRHLRERSDGSYIGELLPARRGWDWQKSEILRSLVEMLVEGQHHRLKICANPGCRWVFLDRTHGNTRRWCSDLTCGNRDKVRRLRDRLRNSRRRRV